MGSLNLGRDLFHSGKDDRKAKSHSCVFQRFKKKAPRKRILNRKKKELRKSKEKGPSCAAI